MLGRKGQKDISPKVHIVGQRRPCDVRPGWMRVFCDANKDPTHSLGAMFDTFGFVQEPECFTTYSFQGAEVRLIPEHFKVRCGVSTFVLNVEVADDETRHLADDFKKT